MAHVIDVPEKAMTADQRCDRCGAQAYMEVALKSGTLLFCNHHGTMHEHALPAYAMIADHRSKLRADETPNKPQPASPA